VSGGVAATSATGRVAWVAVAAGTAAGLAAVVLVGVRQWRFAPRRRQAEAAVLVVAALSAVLVYPVPALERAAWSPLLLAGSLVAALVVGWPVARVADRVHARDEVTVA
jgi:hypothetical protein